MRKRLQEDQNNGKALEVRLEQEGGIYYVILAGMTINLLSGCTRGICEPTGEDEYMSFENETYHAENFDNYRQAKDVYDNWKRQYVD